MEFFLILKPVNTQIDLIVYLLKGGIIDKGSEEEVGVIPVECQLVNNSMADKAISYVMQNVISW